MDYQHYVKRLDELMAYFRAGYLGELVRFTELFPDGAALPPHILAERTAQAMMLHLARIRDLEEWEIQRGFRWLTVACKFLAENCPEEDGTIYNLRRLAQLEQSTLQLMAEDHKLSPEATEIFVAPTWYMEDSLEQAAWEMLDEETQAGMECALVTLGAARA